MKTLYIIDLLVELSHAFDEVFQNFLDDQAFNIPFYCIDGTHSHLNYERILNCKPAAVLITGSPYNFSDELPWRSKLEDFIRECYQLNIPVLGISFGSELIAHAMGGKIEKLRSWEFGIHPVYLHEEATQHPWLEGLPTEFQTLQIHEEHIAELPSEAQSLAFSAQTPHQIFTLGSLMGVQFHPEYTQDMLNEVIKKAPQNLIEKGPFTSEKHLKAVASRWKVPPLPRLVLKNFLKAMITP